jgi:DNA mismatch repair protein MutH
MTRAPACAAELLERAHRLAGRAIGAIAADLDRPVPAIPARAKGWIGELIEDALGASAGSSPEPDFPSLGIELKTVPVSSRGRVLESTYLCTVALRNNQLETWDTSLAQRKLARVLWVPVIADRHLPLAARIVGDPFYWSPSPAEREILRADWQEIMDAVCLGDLDLLSSELGSYLQIRPKAMHGRAKTRTYDSDGTPGWSLPRGFYLRPEFTGRVLRSHAVNE